jgi:hypothetical protein
MNHYYGVEDRVDHRVTYTAGHQVFYAPQAASIFTNIAYPSFNIGYISGNIESASYGNCHSGLHK